MQVFENSIWSIGLSNGWEYKVEDYGTIFFHPDGGGALIISSYTKNSLITKEDVIELAELSSEEIKYLKEVKYGNLKGFELIYSDEEGVFHRNFWLKKGNILLFITYNCGVNDKENEKEVVDKMLSSLRINT